MNVLGLTVPSPKKKLNQSHWLQFQSLHDDLWFLFQIIIFCLSSIERMHHHRKKFTGSVRWNMVIRHVTFCPGRRFIGSSRQRWSGGNLASKWYLGSDDCQEFLMWKWGGFLGEFFRILESVYQDNQIITWQSQQWWLQILCSDLLKWMGNWMNEMSAQIPRTRNLKMIPVRNKLGLLSWRWFSFSFLMFL